MEGKTYFSHKDPSNFLRVHVVFSIFDTFNAVCISVCS